jgi:hypothetical protein
VIARDYNWDYRKTLEFLGKPKHLLMAKDLETMTD